MQVHMQYPCPQIPEWILIYLGLHIDEVIDNLIAVLERDHIIALLAVKDTVYKFIRL